MMHIFSFLFCNHVPIQYYNLVSMSACFCLLFDDAVVICIVQLKYIQILCSCVNLVNRAMLMNKKCELHKQLIKNELPYIKNNCM